MPAPVKVSQAILLRYEHLLTTVVDKQLNAAIEEIALRLRQVERENTTAKRRVRELELELDECKEEVQRERARFQEEMRRQQERSFNDRKGKMRQTAEEEELAIYWEKRYREVLEQKEGTFTFTQHLSCLANHLHQLWRNWLSNSVPMGPA